MKAKDFPNDPHHPLPQESPTMYKALLLLPVALFSLLSLLPTAGADISEALKPFNVPCNTDADEDEPHVAGDNLTLYYTSNKEKEDDIFVVVRPPKSPVWPAKSKIIEDYVSSKGDDRSVFATD